MSDANLTPSDASTVNDTVVATSALNVSNINKRTLSMNTVKMRARKFTITFKL